jgi:hypothetical protein
MANVTINTNITNITDSQSTTTSVSLDGVPNTSSTIITSRTFTPNTNCTFTKIPHISFTKTNNPEDYNYSVKKNGDGSYSFTVNYRRPIAVLPTTDIIEFFGLARINKPVVGNKIYGWNMKTGRINYKGERRVLKIVGDPGATLKIKVTKNPRKAPESNETSLVNEFVATIANNGTYETGIQFPATTLATSYRVILTENISGTFTNGLVTTPTIIYLPQWPLQQVKLQIIETSDTSWTLPSSGINSDYYLYSGAQGSTSANESFSFSCSHASDISADGTFTHADFTQVTGQSATLDTVRHPLVDARVTYKNLTYKIDNTVNPNTVVITGKLDIKHGYDAGGHTYITLNINDILNHA